MAEAKLIQLHGKPLGGGALPIIITPLVGKTKAAVLDEVAAIVPKKPDLLEWRIDFFEGIGESGVVIETARAIRAASGGIPVLLTRRNTTEGGEPIPIAEPAVVAMYTEACKARCVELIDYELSNAPDDLKRLRAVSAEHGVAMIMSYHNFQLTPEPAVIDRQVHRGGAARRRCCQGRGDAQGSAGRADIAGRDLSCQPDHPCAADLDVDGGRGLAIASHGLGLRLGGDVRRRQEQFGARPDRHRGSARRSGHRPQDDAIALHHLRGALRRLVAQPRDFPGRERGAGQHPATRRRGAGTDDHRAGDAVPQAGLRKGRSAISCITCSTRTSSFCSRRWRSTGSSSRRSTSSRRPSCSS